MSSLVTNLTHSRVGVRSLGFLIGDECIRARIRGWRGGVILQFVSFLGEGCRQATLGGVCLPYVVDGKELSLQLIQGLSVQLSIRYDIVVDGIVIEGLANVINAMVFIEVNAEFFSFIE